MLKSFIAGLFFAFMLGGAALAQTCPAYTYTLTNGTTADANQVMANFNTIATCVTTQTAPLASPHFTGSVGIGTTGSYPLLVANGRTTAGDGTAIYLKGYQASLQFMNNAGTQNWYGGVNDASGSEFDIGRGYGPAQGINIALRINASDMIGVSAPPGGWSGNSTFSSYANGNAWAGSFYSASYPGGGAILSRVDNTSTALEMFYYTGSVNIGAIYTNGSTTTYYSASDYRLKTNVEPLTDGLARLMKLQPRKFNWKSGLNEPKSDGFIAHELQAVLPLAVKGEKDAMNTNGTIKAQLIDYSSIIPVLVSAVQEQQAEIEKLRSEVAILKAVQ